jgi:hypothetical protein
MSTKNTLTRIKDAADILDPSTGMVRRDKMQAEIDSINAALTVLAKAQEAMITRLVGVMAANGFNNTEAAAALNGFDVNRLGAIITDDAKKRKLATVGDVIHLLTAMLTVDAPPLVDGTTKGLGG